MSNADTVSHESFSAQSDHSAATRRSVAGTALDKNNSWEFFNERGKATTFFIAV
jgi:hypothetical protein